MAATLSPAAPHLTQDEQAARTASPAPCACWEAGRGLLKGWKRSQVQHPAEYDLGARSAH